MARHEHFEFDLAPQGRREWQRLAACRRSGLDFFSLDRDVQRQCIATCRRCPVVRQCLRYAVESREPEGVWAGQLLSKRRLRALAQRVNDPATQLAPEPSEP
jgi:WhiB family transcriptional regulator, redox-sensing transcriptional regulator